LKGSAAIWSAPCPWCRFSPQRTTARTSSRRPSRASSGRTTPNIEYIIVDGGSTDGTLDIIKKHEDRIAKWVSEPDEGISDAFNKGIRMATGDIIGQIFSDDWYADPTVVRRVVEVFQKNPEVKALYGIQDYVDRATVEVLFKWGRDADPSEIKKRPYIPYPTLFCKKEVYEDIGLFRKDYRVAMDYEFEMRLLKYTRPYFLNYTIACMRDMGYSGKNYMQAFKESVKALWEHKYYFAALQMFLRNTAKYILIKFGLERLIYRVWARNVSPRD
jgi:glycosyltransferase involved in cell wall biosynthesis